MLSPNRKQRRLWNQVWWTIPGAILAVGIIAITYIIHMGGSSLPVAGQAADFTATNVDGQTVKLSNLDGKIRLLTWFYTHCPDECPLTAHRMAQMQDQLMKQGEFGTKVVFVSITLDPIRDTLPVIKEWANQYHANLSGWYFLRANPTQTAQILQAYGVGLKHAHDSEFIEHVVKTELIDQSGNVRVTYPLANLNNQSVLSDIQNLISRETWG